jgi:hypothetical protein
MSLRSAEGGQTLRHCTTANAFAPYIATRLLLRCAHRNDMVYKNIKKNVIAIRRRRRSNLVAIAQPPMHLRKCNSATYNYELASSLRSSQ